MKGTRLFFVITAVSLLPMSALAQVATGLQPYGSFSTQSFDRVNNANLNVHFAVPVLNKAGRGLPFVYSLGYDSSIWTNSGGAWVPNPSSNWGWGGVTGSLIGRITYQTSPGSCTQGGNQYSYNTYSNWSYVRPDGFAVKFNLTLSDESTQTQCTGGPAYSGTATATDGTGFTISATAQPTATIYSRSGDVISAPLNSGAGSGSIVDSNGNEITAASAGNTVFTDTLGTAALTVSGSGTQASPYLYEFMSAAGSQSYVTVNYTSYTVQTSFGCTGITDYPATTQNLVSSIELPDGTSYSFSYEPTTGFPGSVTGRLETVTLPTGGTINYTYTGANNGITCADGSAATLTRTSPEGTWTYTHSESGTAWTTIVNDPQSHQTTYNFQQVSGTGLAYETERQVAGLETVYTCYNGAGEPCNNVSISLPLLQRTQSTSIGGLMSEVSTLYNAFGLPTEIDEYNYGPTLARKTLIAYASLGNYVSDRPATITVQNASGGTVRSTTNTYGNTVTGTSGTPQHVTVTGDRGNLLSTTTSGITESFSYFDTGKVKTITDPAGNQANYTDGDCGNSFMTSVLLPLSLSRGESWNCNGGVIASRTDENGKITSYSYDSMNRLAHISYSDGGSKTISYPSSTQRNVSTALTGSTSRQDTLDLDWLGRVTRKVLASDPEGADTTDIGYDYLGNINSVSNPYRSPADPTYGSDVYAHDVLGRVTSITHADGNSVGFSYGNASPSCGVSGYATTRTDEVGHQRRTFTDALGRIVEVDEPDPANGNSLTLITCYTRDALNDITQIVQGVQTRTYHYDSLSRVTSVAAPESGTTTFSYTSGGALCAGNVKAVCSRTDANGITTTYTYDALSRLTSKTYSNTTPSAFYFYGESTVKLGKTTYTLTNTKGHLSHASTGNNATMIIRSYDAMGRVTGFWQSCASGTNCAPVAISQYTYDLAGDETSYTHPAGYTVTQAINGAQRITQITSSYSDSFHPPTIATMSYTPFGALATLTGSAWPACPSCTPPVQTYDYNNRLQLVREQYGSPSQANAISCIVANYYSDQSTPGSCDIPAQGAGNNRQLISDYDAENDSPSQWSNTSHTDNYTYDSLGRLTQAVGTPVGSGTAAENLSYSYDSYGNMSCAVNGNTNGLCVQSTFDPATNHATFIGTGAPTYDAGGRMVTDAITTNTYGYDAEGRLTGVTNANGASATYQYNALGQLVEQNEYNWDGDANLEILYDAFGRRFGEYDYVSSRGFNVDEWAREYFPYDADAGMYKGPPTSPDFGLYNIFNNLLGSMRYDTNSGDSARNMGLYNPQGNDWETCTSILGYSNYAGFDPHCSCWDRQWYIGPDGRPYDFSTGRWMGPQAPGSFDPDNLNNYEYAANDPINNIDPGTGDPSQPPLPGTDQLQRALDWLRDQLNASTCTSFGCFAVNAGFGFTEGLGYGLAADTAAPAVARAAAAAGPAVTAAASTAATAVGTAAASYGPQAVQAVTDFHEGMEQPYIPAENFAGKVGQFFGFLERMLD